MNVVRLSDLKVQALRYLALGEVEGALLVYRTIIREVPTDLDARMKVADVLCHAGLFDLAGRVYSAVAWCDLQAGRPLHALVCCQALRDLDPKGGDPSTSRQAAVVAIWESFLALYSKGAARLSREGGLLVPPDPDTEVNGVDLTPLPGTLAAESAAEMAADTTTFPTTQLPPPRPIPLLSELSSEDLSEISSCLLIKRLPPRTVVQPPGTISHSCYLLASGSLEVVDQGPPRRVLERTGEGTLVGELSLLEGGYLRSDLLETAEPSDLIEIPARLLRPFAKARPKVEAALQQFLGDRLLWQLMEQSPLFAPLTYGQKRELLGRFVTIKLADEEILCRKGEPEPGLYLLLAGTLEIFHGEEPFETVEGHLREGDLHGQEALLQKDAVCLASWSLRAAGPCVLSFLSVDAFTKAKNTLPALARHMDQLADQT